jgi:hypothetical protein
MDAGDHPTLHRKAPEGPAVNLTDQSPDVQKIGYTSHPWADEWNADPEYRDHLRENASRKLAQMAMDHDQSILARITETVVPSGDRVEVRWSTITRPYLTT